LINAESIKLPLASIPVKSLEGSAYLILLIGSESPAAQGTLTKACPLGSSSTA
jgi:hypothetical protein